MKVTIKTRGDRYVITLSDVALREALALERITSFIGGDPAGPRGVAEGINDALAAEGLSAYDDNRKWFPRDGGGDIWFADQWPEDLR